MEISCFFYFHQGYVRFFGDEDVSSTPDRARMATMLPDEQRRAFPFKPLYQRVLVVLAGPVANFVLAIAIFTVLRAAVAFASSLPLEIR